MSKSVVLPRSCHIFFLEHTTKRKKNLSLLYSLSFPNFCRGDNYFWAQRMWYWYCHKSALLQSHKKPHVGTHTHTHMHAFLLSLPLLFYHFYFQFKLKCDIDEKQRNSGHTFQSLLGYLYVPKSCSALLNYPRVFSIHRKILHIINLDSLSCIYKNSYYHWTTRYESIFQSKLVN